ncbi:Uncharacterised protein [Bordetella pertussis]|nr:Uncharacterised protein [Bordetella pertussis]
MIRCPACSGRSRSTSSSRLRKCACSSEGSDTRTTMSPSRATSWSMLMRIAWMSQSADSPRRAAGGMNSCACRGSGESWSRSVSCASVCSTWPSASWRGYSVRKKRCCSSARVRMSCQPYSPSIRLPVWLNAGSTSSLSAISARISAWSSRARMSLTCSPTV